MTRPSAPWPCFRIRNLVPLSRAESPSMYSRPGYMQWILQLYIKCRVHSTCILSAAPPEQDPPNAARCRRRDSRSCWSRSSSCIDRPVGIQVVRVWIQGVSVVMYANKESAPFNGFQRMPQHAEIEQNFRSTTAKKKCGALNAMQPGKRTREHHMMKGGDSAENISRTFSKLASLDWSFANWRLTTWLIKR